VDQILSVLSIVEAFGWCAIETELKSLQSWRFEAEAFNNYLDMIKGQMKK